jgi:uncharacterized protein
MTMLAGSVVAPAFTGEPYAPDHRVRVDGQLLSPRERADIVDIHVTLDLKGASAFSFTVSDWDDVKLDFKYSSSRRFDLGTPVSIDLGYVDDLVRVINGEVVSLTPTFPESGAPTLTVRGQDKMRELANGKPKPGERKSFPNATDPEVAQAIAERLHLHPVVSSKRTPRHPRVVQKNQSYQEFLLERAKSIDFEFYFGVDQGTQRDALYFVERADGRDTQPVRMFTLVWGLGSGPRTKDPANAEPVPNLLSFSPKLSSADQVGEVSVRGWNPRTKKSIVYTATPTDLPGGAGSSDGGPARAQRGAREAIIDRPFASVEEAKAYAISLLMERANCFVEGTGRVAGVPRMQPGNWVELQGLGRSFSGRYYVTKVDHTLGAAGFTTTFEVDRSRQERPT